MGVYVPGDGGIALPVVFVNRYCYPDHSATSQLLSDLVFHLGKQGIAVSVIASRQRYDDADASLPRSEVVGGVQIYRVSGTRFGRHTAVGRLLDYASFVLGARNELKRLVGDNTIVVAKTDPPMLGMFLSSIVRRRGGRLVNWLQDLFPETLSALSGNRVIGLVSMPLMWLRNRSLKRAAVNVVIGERMRSYLVDSGVPADKVMVVHNWPYETTDVGADRERKLREEWELRGDFVVGYFGNLGRVHEHETMLEAMRILASETGIRFLFVGGGFLLEKLKREAAENGLENFEHRDYVPREDLPAALKAVDAHLVTLNPALEGFVVPSKFAGVAAAGKPVLYVGDRDGELGRTIREAGCGHVLDVGDSQGLARRIREMAGDPKALQRMGESAARLYREQYRADALLEKWRRVLTALDEGASNAPVEIRRGDRI